MKLGKIVAYESSQGKLVLCSWAGDTETYWAKFSKPPEQVPFAHVDDCVLEYRPRVDQERPGPEFYAVTCLKPVLRLTEYEQRDLLNDPAALALLMNYEDFKYSSHSAAGHECMGSWPTARYLEFYERGRKIILEDPEIWDMDLKRQFGFKK